MFEDLSCNLNPALAEAFGNPPTSFQRPLTFALEHCVWWSDAIITFCRVLTRSRSSDSPLYWLDLHGAGLLYRFVGRHLWFEAPSLESLSNKFARKFLSLCLSGDEIRSLARQKTTIKGEQNLPKCSLKQRNLICRLWTDTIMRLQLQAVTDGRPHSVLIRWMVSPRDMSGDLLSWQHPAKQLAADRVLGREWHAGCQRYEPLPLSFQDTGMETTHSEYWLEYPRGARRRIGEAAQWWRACVAFTRTWAWSSAERRWGRGHVKKENALILQFIYSVIIWEKTNMVCGSRCSDCQYKNPHKGLLPSQGSRVCDGGGCWKDKLHEALLWARKTSECWGSK